MGRSRVSGLFVRQRSLAYCFIAGLGMRDDFHPP
jgi:hypothetical protein